MGGRLFLKLLKLASTDNAIAELQQQNLMRGFEGTQLTNSLQTVATQYNSLTSVIGNLAVSIKPADDKMGENEHKDNKDNESGEEYADFKVCIGGVD